VGDDTLKKQNKEMKKNTKAVAVGNLIADGLSSLLGDVLKILQPLFKVLSLLFLVIFLPLMPLIVELTKAVVSIIEGLTKLFGGEINLGEFLKQYLGPALLKVLITIAKILLTIIIGIGKLLWETFKLLVEIIVAVAGWIWDKLTQAFGFVIDLIVSAGTWLWDAIVSGFQFILGIGSKIWQFFLDGLSFISDLGQKIWNFIWEGLKGVGTLIANGFKTMINGLIDVINWIPGIDIPHLANGGIVTSPTTALIGEAGPEAVIPLSKMGGMGTTININNPTIRDDSDIRKLTDSISRELQKRGNRGFSSI